MAYSRRVQTSTRLSLLAAVALGAAGLVLAGSASAQSDTQAKSAHHSTWGGRHESVDERIAGLHERLHITPEEETSWLAVAHAMAENDRAMAALTETVKLNHDQHRTAVEDLHTYEKFNQAHVDGLKNLIPAFESLYAVMPPSQKLTADEVFRRFGHEKERARHSR